MKYLNIATYKFIEIKQKDLAQIKLKFYEVGQELQLKGTILLSEEGINLFLAGLDDKINSFKQFLQTISQFKDLTFRVSWSEKIPFSRLVVRIKPEIITMGKSEIKPFEKPAAYITPKLLKQWLDEGKKITLLDTRNQYEYQFGTFKNALQLNIKYFRQFPQAVSTLPKQLKLEPVVTFCTGGIRCEKAASFLESQGYQEVYQLQGGILNYFAECGGAHYQGECFMFDNRVSVDSQLQETAMTHCKACQEPISLEQVAFQSQGEATCNQCDGAIRQK